MLQPSNRLTLIDAMRPPPGFSFSEAMAVTFTLDLRALLAAPAAFAFEQTGTDLQSDDQTAEPIELLHAIRSHSDHITVFCQAGEIGLPPSRRVFAFLEQSVVPVTAPRGGVVHPKIWVLRYESTSDPSTSTLRVLCASRNLTFDASWDTLLRLDETDSATGCELTPVATLFERLAERATSPISESHTTRVSHLGTLLRKAKFSLPPGTDDLRLHVMGFDKPDPPFPGDADRSLIISPFVSNDFFSRVHRGSVGELVSRPESLDQLKPAVRDAIGSVYAFDDGSSPEMTEAESDLSLGDPGRPLRGLHAKVFAFETGARATVFVGSANATGAAFGSNVEVLAEMTGPKATLGIDRLCGGTDDEVGLRALFQTYTGGSDSVDSDDSTLDMARGRLARLVLDGFVAETPSGWEVTYKSDKAVDLPAGVTAICWPLSNAGNLQPVVPGKPLNVTFQTTVESMSGFLAMRLTLDEPDITTGFVLPVNLHGVPTDRDRKLLKALVGNADRFFRYLLSLLDEGPTGMELLDAIDQMTSDTGHSDRRSSFDLPVLEKLLRSLRRDPAKLISVHPLVVDLDSDGVLPDGFMELWAPIHEIAVEAERAES